MKYTLQSINAKYLKYLTHQKLIISHSISYRARCEIIFEYNENHEKNNYCKYSAS